MACLWSHGVLQQQYADDTHLCMATAHNNSSTAQLQINCLTVTLSQKQCTTYSSHVPYSSCTKQ